MVEINIIKAKSKDVKLVAELIAELLTDFNALGKSTFVIDMIALEKVTGQLISRENFGAFIAYDSNNIPKGLITLTEASAIYNGGDFGVITEFYVDRKSRSVGIGKLLLQTAIEFSKTKGWTKIEVGAPMAEQWPRTIEFYEKNGFKQKGVKLRVDVN